MSFFLKSKGNSEYSSIISSAEMPFLKGDDCENTVTWKHIFVSSSRPSRGSALLTSVSSVKLEWSESCSFSCSLWSRSGSWAIELISLLEEYSMMERISRSRRSHSLLKPVPLLHFLTSSWVIPDRWMWSWVDSTPCFWKTGEERRTSHKLVESLKSSRKGFCSALTIVIKVQNSGQYLKCIIETLKS